MNDWLPELVLLNDHNGSWEPYLETLYVHFRRDFIETRLAFRSCRVGLKRHPIEHGKECTFWHLISEGKIESERLPNLRRCERICWPRPMIELEDTRRLPVWSQIRKGERRIAISVEDFSYVLILAERSTSTGLMYLPWTAYCVEYAHQRNKYRKEWEANRI